MTPMQPSNLRCEYFVDPIGIDAATPRLSWLSGAARQSAYQVVVDGVWDSGKVESDQSIHVAYGGRALRSRQRFQWKVRVWDGDGQASQWSEPATFEMGLLNRADWRAKWIGSHVVGGPYSIPPTPYLRKTFSLAQPIAWARLFVTALGLYRFAINGRRVGDAVLTPGRTDYDKRVPYDVFDVTAHLRDGENACEALLGDGWYCGHLHSDPRQTYGDRPRLLAQLEVSFADDSMQTIVSDESWQAAEGPIRSSDMLMGEDVDARFGICDWRPVVVFADPGIELVARRAPRVRKMQELKPVAPPVVSKNRRRHIFDMGQNMVGWVRLTMRDAPPGKTIDLRYTEMLDREGKPYTSALRTARATDHYTTRGSGGAGETFEPKFTFHGFRYVEVRDYPGGNPTVDDLTGVVVHSDCEPTGEFECSDPMLNQLQKNIVWSQRGNFLDIPTDCPQRDERAGWTGDAQVFIRTAAFNMDVANFFTKWLQDVADAQDAEGRIPSVVPHIKSFYHEGGPAWADAGVICPWTIYLCYGDEKILEQCWPMMARFMGFLERNCKDFIRADEHWKWKGYGDWLSMNAETPSDFIGTAFYAHCASLMAKIARVLGRGDDAAKFDELHANVSRAFVKRFLDTRGELTVKTQTAYVLALHFDLLDEKLRPAALASLVADIEAREMHLSTGFVGTPYLNHVLTRFGRTDVAYALLMQKTYPSWLYPVTQGATTMWERWDAWTHDKGFSDTGMNSFNHYAFGAVGAWMYQAIAGIDLDESRPGYKHIVFRPQPGGGLTSARGRLKSMYGVIESAWRIDDNDANPFRLDVAVPPNTTATVHLPDGAAHEVSAGKHAFRCRPS
jgi:alpha-L-rhamnosidase